MLTMLTRLAELSDPDAPSITARRPGASWTKFLRTTSSLHTAYVTCC